MKHRNQKSTVVTESRNFPLFRISHSKAEVGMSPNTVRAMIADGLPAYKRGKMLFISKDELYQLHLHQPGSARSVKLCTDAKASGFVPSMNPRDAFVAMREAIEKPEVVNLLPIGNKQSITTESQARELSKVEPVDAGRCVLPPGDRD